jgi:catechol 2,3-dioxygenase-like lactoylglutathione lyase family enzyme
VLADADIVPFLPTADLDRARQFYGDRLGLPLLEQTGFACVFQAPNATLRVTLVESPAHAPYTVLGWQVPDIEVAVAELRGRGVEPIHYDGLDQDPLGIWRSPSGARVAWFADPDRNVLSMTQLCLNGAGRRSHGLEES